jgi:hypothetical protein
MGACHILSVGIFVTDPVTPFIFFCELAMMILRFGVLGVLCVVVVVGRGS